MTYAEATEYLFNVAPLFQNIGQGAYKEGLSNTLALDEHFGHPHRSYRTIHVAGTNGKGSCSHTIASLLQHAGYKVGLYTSPHLIDFRERIRVNGQMISEQRVIDFVEQERSFFEPLYPSFFELATALAFKYFEEQKVDVAVIEVGLGGRLDCTNIIQPDLSIITNISFDHVQFLGNTLEAIAKEKAGIIKPDTPVVIGETNGHEEVREVFRKKALENNALLTFAEESNELISSKPNGVHRTYVTHTYGTLEGELGGECQTYNTRTILAAVQQLKALGYNIAEEDVQEGFRHVCETTGLMGRWQKISDHPLTLCDTGHNVGGLQYISQHLKEILEGAQSTKHKAQCEDESTKHKAQSTKQKAQSQDEKATCVYVPQLRIVMGMVGDKDVKSSLARMPKNAVYYFTQASVKRAMKAEDIYQLGLGMGLNGKVAGDVKDAYALAKQEAHPKDILFIGGSSFVVADLLRFALS